MLLKIVILCVLYGVARAQVGDECRDEQTNSQGICKRIDQCQHVLNDTLSNKAYTRCGSQGLMEMVCCPSLSDHQKSVGPRISETKCIEYSAAVYTTVRVMGRVRKVNRCGVKTIPLVVGGERAKSREFPHMALLGVNTKDGIIDWECGGSLISDEFVMTAAHCIRIPSKGNITHVRLGELDLESTEDATRTEDFNVSQLILHPQYRTSSKYNDIALVKLDRKVEFDSYKRPACLATQFSGPERNAIATGWGRTDWSGASSSELLKVTLELFPHAECNEIIGNDDRKLREGIKDEQQICAGSRLANRDTCQGDSGGPLQVFHSTQYCMYTIIGVTSFGVSCGTLGVPGVYTRVYEYLDWIESVVWPTV